MKQTKLRAVKDVANALLQLDPHMTKFSPLVISHPFSSSGITAIMKNGETTILNIAESKDDLKEWRKAMQYQINHASDPFEIYMMVNMPYALTFLKLAKPYLSEKDFSTILASAWIQTEAPNQDIDVSKSQLLSMFKAADPSVLMDEDELQQWRDLDDEITVYRGVTPYNEKTSGLSRGRWIEKLRNGSRIDLMRMGQYTKLESKKNTSMPSSMVETNQK